MKYIYLVIIVVLTIAFSCTPEKIVNKKLSGTWKVTKINGVEVENPSNHTFTFINGKRYDGDVKEEIIINGDNQNSKGIYSLYKNYSITMAFSEDPNIDTRIYKFDEISKTKIIMHLENDQTQTLTLEK